MPCAHLIVYSVLQCLFMFEILYLIWPDRVAQSYVRGPGFDIRSGHILSFLLPLIQEGQLVVNGESVCTKYCLTA